MSGALRRSRKPGHFSSQLEVSSAQSAGYTGHFPQRGHIPAVFGAKFAATRLFRALSAAQGLPSPEQGLPSVRASPNKMGEREAPFPPAIYRPRPRLGTGPEPAWGLARIGMPGPFLTKRCFSRFFYDFSPSK
jgi:hypothetical protein